MARLRLFAGLRESAGAGEVEVAGATVNEVLANAAAVYGPTFAAGMRHAQVWVNGDRADPDTPLAEGDEVALIPPVSGGAAAAGSTPGLPAAMVGALVAALLAANFLSSPVFVTVLVAVGGLWAWDLTTGLEDVERGPVLLSVLAGALLPYGLGRLGFGLAAVAVVIGTMAWGLIFPRARTARSLAATFAAAFLAATAAGSLVVSRLGPEGARRVGGFLLLVVAAGLVTWLVLRYPMIPNVDPLTAGSLAAVLVGAIVGEAWGPSLVTFLLVGVVSALALIAGRAFGSVVRSGEVFLIEPLPGALGAIDGPIAAAALLAPTLALLA